MAAMAGFLHHSLTAAHPLGASAASTGTSTDASSTPDSGTISANDFLTLLVTEMQNQDPTADTDPNEYINQLVQVNSLEQLISINQTLTTDLGSSGTTSPSGSTTGTQPATTVSSSVSGVRGHGAIEAVLDKLQGGAIAGKSALPSDSPALTALQSLAQSAKAQETSGNLSIPAESPAARRVAHALDGEARAPGAVVTTGQAR